MTPWDGDQPFFVCVLSVCVCRVGVSVVPLSLESVVFLFFSKQPTKLYLYMMQSLLLLPCLCYFNFGV